MAKRKTTTATVESILARHSPEIRDLVERLRAIVRESVPEASETANPGWHSISYRHPQSGYFCGIFPQDGDVLLAFEFGILLSDPDGVLEGKGTQVRFARIKRKRDIRVRAFKKLIKAALDLPASRSIKLEMMRTSSKLM